jgi:membrane protein DedA with SNARE-associated domain
VIAGFVMMILLNVKIIGTILTLISSGIWAYLGYLLIGEFTDLKKLNIAWTILILVVLFILSFGLHVLSKEDLNS